MDPEELNALQAIATLFAQLQARIAAEEQLQYLAQHDDLSGLLNRRALMAHLDQRLAEGRPGPVSALFLDLDRLKTVNDYLGHSAGDQFIKMFAERLRAGTERPAAIARVGGDEFVVVPDDPMDVETVESFARQLQTFLQRRVEIDGEMLARTVSIGVAVRTPVTTPRRTYCAEPTRPRCRQRAPGAAGPRCSPPRWRRSTPSATTSRCISKGDRRSQ